MTVDRRDVPFYHWWHELTGVIRDATSMIHLRLQSAGIGFVCWGESGGKRAKKAGQAGKGTQRVPNCRVTCLVFPAGVGWTDGRVILVLLWRPCSLSNFGWRCLLLKFASCFSGWIENFLWGNFHANVSKLLKSSVWHNVADPKTFHNGCWFVLPLVTSQKFNWTTSVDHWPSGGDGVWFRLDQIQWGKWLCCVFQENTLKLQSCTRDEQGRSWAFFVGEKEPCLTQSQVFFSAQLVCVCVSSSSLFFHFEWKICIVMLRNQVLFFSCAFHEDNTSHRKWWWTSVTLQTV